jgi:hypothetical protein
MGRNFSSRSEEDAEFNMTYNNSKKREIEVFQEDSELSPGKVFW